jgi:hypothetical protein
MNIDIRKGQYESYKTQKRILDALEKKDDTAAPMDDDDPSTESQSTLSFGTWSRGQVNWADFLDSASTSTTQRQAPVDEDYEDETAASEDASDEDSDD